MSTIENMRILLEQNHAYLPFFKRFRKRVALKKIEEERSDDDEYPRGNTSA